MLPSVIQWKIVSKPPDLTLCNFRLLPRVKMILKGKCFELTEDIQAATAVRLKTRQKEFHTERLKEEARVRHTEKTLKK